MATSTPVLDLNTVAPQVRIDGDFYVLRVRDDLSILTNTDYSKKLARIDVLRLNGQRTKKEETELATLLEQMCGVLLVAPASVIEALTMYQRLAVVNAFFRQVAAANPSRTVPAKAAATSKKSPRV